MAEALNLTSVIGFNGSVENGLLLHPDAKTFIYPLGSTIVLRDVEESNQQEFLQGHSDKVSCLAISKSGRYLASGQVTYMGFKADIIIWDLESRKLKHRLSLHKVMVQALDFSHDEKYLASLGGQDDNSLVLWDVETGEAVCGSPADNAITVTVKFFTNQNDRMVTGGNDNLKIWEFDRPQNKLLASDVALGQKRRNFTSITIDEVDRFMYCGTTSGDILQVSLERKLFRNSGPAKEAVQQGVTAVTLAPSGDILLGGGDGSLLIIRQDVEGGDARFLHKLPAIAKSTLNGSITSLTPVPSSWNGRTFTFFVGTKKCDIFKVIYDAQAKTLSHELVQTSHWQRINDLAFPYNYSDVFATAGMAEIRIWHLESRRELLRISVPNLECDCVAFTQDGSAILSGWSDGKIRVFGPQSGKLLFTIHDAHHRAVTAIAEGAGSGRIVSGGEEGMVRVWRASKTSQVMEASMKEHKGAVNCIKIKESSGEECVSASADGSCIIWDLKSFHRRASLFANTVFTAVAYHPDESQLVTAGSDRKVSYWDAYDGQAIRVLEASDTQPINCINIDVQGEAIVSGSTDKLVKVWGYDEGHCAFVGQGHSGQITKVAVTPDRTKIVSVGSEGGILVWDYHTPHKDRTLS